MSLTETEMQAVIQFFLEDFDGFFDETSQIYQYGGFRGTKGELMEDDMFQGYSSAFIGLPTPEEYLEGLEQRKPKLFIRRRDESLGKRHEIVGLHESGFAGGLYRVKAENYELGWYKGNLRKEKIRTQMQKCLDEPNYLS